MVEIMQLYYEIMQMFLHLLAADINLRSLLVKL